MKLKVLSQQIVAILIILLGIGFLLNTLHVWDFNNVLSHWWPVAIILLGVANLMNEPRYPLWPSFVIGAGAALLLKENKVISFDVWDVVWPLALIVIGGSFIYRQLWGHPHEVNEDSVSILGAFSGHESVANSSDFQGGNITILFGGVKLDLRQVVIKKTAHLEVFTAFGGTELIVPKGWRIKTGGLPLFGGWDNKTTPPASKDAPLLVVHGVCLFGGVEIKNQ